MFVIGRGYGFGVAQECALKLKETCQLQAEPFSAAEVRHGRWRSSAKAIRCWRSPRPMRRATT